MTFYEKSETRLLSRLRRWQGARQTVCTLIVALTTTTLSSVNTRAQSQEASSVTVETITPERSTSERTVKLVGHVRPWNQAILYSKVSGYLEWIGVDLGSWVEKGEVLARIDDPEMRSDLARFRADAKAKRSIYDRIDAAKKENPDMVSQLEVDRALGEVQSAEALAQRIQRLVEDAQLTAPYHGVITDRWVDPGALIQAATSSQSSSARIVRIMDFDTVRVAVSVPEPDCPHLRQGATAIVRTSNLPDEEFIGTVARFAWAIDPMSRTMETEVDVTNLDHHLRPGMYAVVEIALEEPREALRLPSETILIEGDKRFVWTVRNGQAHRIEVTVKNDTGVYAEVVSGLTGTEAIVRRGHLGLTEGAIVQSKEAAQSAAN